MTMKNTITLAMLRVFRRVLALDLSSFAMLDLAITVVAFLLLGHIK